MGSSGLMKARQIVPIAMLTLGLWPITWPIATALISDAGLVGEPADIAKYAHALLLVALGYIYDMLQVRSIANGKSLNRINDFVAGSMRDTLLTALPAKDVNKAPQYGRHWNNLLYSQVDNDQTLREKAALIRNNGIIWSSFADAAVIWIPCGIALNLIQYLSGGTTGSMYGAFLLVLGIAGALLVRVAEKRHMELCREQQEYLAAHRLKELALEFKKIFP